MRLLLAAVLALGASGLLAAPEPSARQLVERARVIVHLKVLRIAQEGKPLDPAAAPEDTRHAPDIALCSVREFLFGSLFTTADGCVGLTSASTKGKREAGDVSYSPGDELTLVCERVDEHPRYQSLLDGSGHAARRPAGPPSKALRALLQARSDRAWRMLDALRGPMREAASGARAKLRALNSGELRDLTSLTPEQDLLADLVAVTMGEPALCDRERPDLGRTQRQALVKSALMHALTFDAGESEMLAPLFGAQGHGLHAMLRPADGSDAALKALAPRFESQRTFLSMLAELARANTDAAFAPWLAVLLESEWNKGDRIGDLCVDMLAEQTLAPHSLIEAMHAPASEELPYGDQAARAVARVLDAGANRLFLWLAAHGHGLPGESGAKFTGSKPHEQRVLRAREAFNSDAALVLLLRFALDDAGSREKQTPSMRLASQVRDAQRKSGKTPPDLGSPQKIAAEAQRRKVRIPDELLIRMEDEQK